jgi:hypothetical protein
MMVQQDNSSALYLTPFKIYELALAGMVASLEQLRLCNGVMEANYLTGSAAILASIFTLSEQTLLKDSTARAHPKFIGTSQALWADYAPP